MKYNLVFITVAEPEKNLFTYEESFFFSVVMKKHSCQHNILTFRMPACLYQSQMWK